MISYAKIWTSIFNDSWFLSLNCQQRGLWLQIIVMAKSQGDVGRFFNRSCTAFAQTMGGDRSVVANSLRKFQLDGRLNIVLEKGKPLEIEILNYSYWQGLKNDKDWRNNPKPVDDISTYNSNNNNNKNSNKNGITTYDPEIIIKTHKIEYDKSKKPIENLKIWNESKEADEMISALTATVGYEIEWVEHEWTHKFIPEVSIKADWAFDSLFNNHNGSWKEMFWSWLKRAKRYGNRDTFYQGRIK